MDYIPGFYLDPHYEGQPFIIPPEARRQHIYVIGKTGAGKSTALERMIYADIVNGDGFAVLDPHGSLVDRIADAVGDRAAQTVLLDPLDAHPRKFNPLSGIPVDDRATVADNMCLGLQHVYPKAWGDRMDDILNLTLRLLMDNKLTLDAIPKILNDDDYRESLTCIDPDVAAFWADEFAEWKDQFREVAVSPVLNKLRTFGTNPRLKRVFGGEGNIDLDEIMNDGKILLCNLSKQMGNKPSKILGSLLVTGFAQAAMRRAKLPQKKLRPFRLYIDEFQNFTNDAMAEMLSEARKYKLELVLAHQYREQIEDFNLREAVIATTSTKIVFRVGTTDAPRFADELEVTEKQLRGLPNYQAYVTTMNGPDVSKTEKIEIRPVELPVGSKSAVLFHSTKERFRGRR